MCLKYFPPTARSAESYSEEEDEDLEDEQGDESENDESYRNENGKDMKDEEGEDNNNDGTLPDADHETQGRMEDQEGKDHMDVDKMEG